MKIHVILLNDSPQFAVLEDEEYAKTKMAELTEAHYKNCKDYYDDRQDYNWCCHWRSRTVDGALIP